MVNLWRKVSGGALGLLAASLMPFTASFAQDQTSDPETRVDDIVVVGRQLEEAVERYVENLSAPARTRGLARWDTPVCVGVVNFQPMLANEISGRIRQVATALGVTVEPDGCDPNIVVMGADDGQALADAMVDRFRAKFFRLSSTQTNRGSAALETFRHSPDAVRWWHVSLPVHAITGTPQIRLPGRPPTSPPCYLRSVAVYDVSVAHLAGGRSGARCNGIADRMLGLWVIVEPGELTDLSVAQLTDYLAFVAMAQVDPDTDMSQFDTVMNLFRSPATVEGITEWDEIYLRSLYAGESQRLDAREQAARMVGSMSTQAAPP